MNTLLMRVATAVLVVASSMVLYGCCCCGGPSLPTGLVQNYKLEAPEEAPAPTNAAMRGVRF